MLRPVVRVLAACVIGKVYFDNRLLISSHPAKLARKEKDAGEFAPLSFFFAAKALQCRFYKAMMSVAPEMGLVTK